MTLEHSDTIYQRYQNGLRWKKVYDAGTIGALTREYGACRKTICKVLAGECTYLGTEAEAEIRQKHQAALEAEPLWRQDSVDAIRKDYGMSGDTFNKILDSRPDVMDITKKFLTGRF